MTNKRIGIIELQTMFKALPEKIRKGEFKDYRFWTISRIWKNLIAKYKYNG